MNSMTGFGVAQGPVGRYRLVLEARSLNHRFCDVSVRTPARFAVFEPEIGRRVRERFTRGKIEVFLREESVDREDKEIILAKKSYAVLRKIQKELGISAPITLSDILTCREIVYAHPSHEDLEGLRKTMVTLLDRSLDGLQKMRESEGERLGKWFEGRIQFLLNLLASIEREAVRRGQDYHKKLKQKFKSVAMEEGRVLQEAALMAGRADITEEIVRLRSHLKEFQRMVRRKEPIGRKLDFMAQEMGREINTIGSKSQEVKVAHQVVEFKSELERIREQVQNVE